MTPRPEIRNCTERRLPLLGLFFAGLRKGAVDLCRAPRQRPLSAEALLVLERGVSVLEAFDLQPMVSEGTLLGAYRQGNFIPHDSDVDVGVVGPVQTLRLLHALRKEGFVPVRLLWSKGRIQQIASCFRETGDVFDISVWWRDNRDMMVLRFPELDYEMIVPAWQFDGSSGVKIEGKCFRTHAKPESWLVAQYGPLWRVPETAKSDWRAGAPFRGPYLGGTDADSPGDS